MANWCDWDCTIVTVEPEKLFQQIQAKIAEARQRNTALFIGSDRYLFDSCVEITGDEITLTGNTRWCFCPDEMEKFVLFLGDCMIRFSRLRCNTRRPDADFLDGTVMKMAESSTLS